MFTSLLVVDLCLDPDVWPGEAPGEAVGVRHQHLGGVAHGAAGHPGLRDLVDLCVLQGLGVSLRVREHRRHGARGQGQMERGPGDMKSNFGVKHSAENNNVSIIHI